jgi:cytochrome c peroxidase
MHDGCFTTLEDVVRHHLDPVRSYDAYSPRALPAALAATLDRSPVRRAQRLAALDPLLRSPVALSAEEVGALVAFLRALTDPASLRADEPAQCSRNAR